MGYGLVFKEVGMEGKGGRERGRMIWGCGYTFWGGGGGEIVAYRYRYRFGFSA